MSKEELEKEYGGKICSGRDLELNHTEVWRWLCIPKHKFTDNVLAVVPDKGGFDLYLYWFTKEYQVKIVVKYPTEENTAGYLLGVIQKRAPLPGETHLRESDLSDGEYSREKFVQILCDVTGYESQSLSILN
jgi:hypothetical protein